MRCRKLVATLCVVAICSPAATSVAQEDFVAGTAPSQRPQTAPVINEIDKSGDWYLNALTGVTEPYPASLRFLEDQGAWYTPFSHPGMTGPYDIRGWHDDQ